MLGRKGSVKPTPTIHRGNMDKRRELPDTFKGRKSSNRDEQKFLFLDMKMRWPPEGDLQFGVFRKNKQQLKNVGKESTHTPGTLRAIPSGVLNRLAKLTSRKPSIHSEDVDKIHPEHANALRKAGLPPTNFPTMGDLWRNQDEKVDT